MAYFSNSSEGMIFDDECDECRLDYCPITHIQMFFNYEQVGNEMARKIMNLLVKEEDGKYIGCQMKPMIDDLFKEQTK